MDDEDDVGFVPAADALNVLLVSVRLDCSLY
jgi:hypothetical protein